MTDIWHYAGPVFLQASWQLMLASESQAPGAVASLLDLPCQPPACS